MDPITQGVVGSAFAQISGRTEQLAKAAVIGAIAGMVPDLDILIRSSRDPLLALEFHRHFTHSLFSIPLGGFLCSLLLYPLLGKRWQLSFLQTLIWCVIGYATHALLDGCTSYGTQLLWPFSRQRFSWDIVSVVDPLFTLPLLTLIILSSLKKSRRFLISAFVWGVAYLLLAFFQHERALKAGFDLAAQRGHHVQRLEAKPSFGNIAVWKIVYESEAHFYVDAVKPGLGQTVLWAGSKIPKLNIQRDLPWLDPHSQQAKDIQRFSWFSAGFIALYPSASTGDNVYRIADIRYSMLPQDIKPLWGIELMRDAPQNNHVKYYTQRENSAEALKELIAMMLK